MLSRRLRELRHDDAGMTLTEVLVGATLLSIVGAMCINFFVTMSSEASRTTDASLATATARTAMRVITSALWYSDTPTTQPGYPTGRFETITASSIVFYSNVTPNRPAPAGGATPPNRTAPAKIAIQASGGKLVESTYLPKVPGYTGDYATNYNATPSVTSVLVPNLKNTDVFTYCTAATDPALTCTPATTTTSVASVGVKLVVPGLSGETDQTMQSMVSITGALS